MTRIILIVDIENDSLLVEEDERPARELVMAINSGMLRVGASSLPGDLLEDEQWAVAHPEVDTVTVLLQPPPVRLSPRLYEVLYGLADGKPAARIAAELGITTRTVYQHIATLKARFAAERRADLMRRAVEFGMIERE